MYVYTYVHVCMSYVMVDGGGVPCTSTTVVITPSVHEVHMNVCAHVCSM